MKSYEYKDSGGRNLCKQHHMLRCSECFYVDVLERENKRYREFIETVSSNWEIARKIKSQRKQHIIGPAHLLEYINSEANKLLERST